MTVLDLVTNNYKVNKWNNTYTTLTLLIAPKYSLVLYNHFTYISTSIFDRKLNEWYNKKIYKL